MRDRYSLTMSNGEDLISYGRRAVKTYERIGTSGVPETHFPTPKQQARRFIEGLSSSVPTYNDYKNYLSNSLAVSNSDVYPTTLVSAINCVTKFHRGAKVAAPTLPTTTFHTSLLTVEEHRNVRKKGTRKDPKQPRKDKTAPDSERASPEKPKDKSKITCYTCGKLGHYSSDCKVKKATGPPASHNVSAAIIHDNETESFYTTFGQMFDDEDIITRGCNTNIIVSTQPDAIEILHVEKLPPQPRTTEAIFDTGATGTIIANAEVLSDIQTCTPTLFKGLHGTMTVTQAGQLADIGIVHYDSRAVLSVISASDCLRQGHQWQFIQGASIDEDAFVVHTASHTYKFQHRNGLYITDLAAPPEARYGDAPSPRNISAHPAIICTPTRNMLYNDRSQLPTAAENEAAFTKREVTRSGHARKFQASLGFPPDDKLITALNAGTFLNCDILPSDVKRATAIWGLSVAALKGRTTRQRPLPPPQALITTRASDNQHMHCDLMFVNKQPYLVSITNPIGLILVALVEQVSAPALRQGVRRMFGTFAAKKINITHFTSDNERGITALFGDMNAMGVTVVTVGPGQHDHTAERMIRTLKEAIRSTIFSLPYILPDIMMPHLVLSSAKKLLLFPSSSTRSDKVSPFEVFFGRRPTPNGTSVLHSDHTARFPTD